MRKIKQVFIIVVTLLPLACLQYEPETFGYDIELLKKHCSPTILTNEFASIAALGEWQGRVLTSTSRGFRGKSYGWINQTLLENNSVIDDFSSIGGECRLWFGPEAGKFSLFFEPGLVQNHDNIAVPPDMSTEKFKLTEKTDTSVTFKAQMHFTNYSQTEFNIEVNRRIKIFTPFELKKSLVIAFKNQVSCVGYKVSTTMTNMGNEDWTTDKGLISLWDISTFPSTPNTTVVIPVRNNPDTVVRYFTKPGDDRLKIIDSTVFYKGDGQFLNKIGILAGHAKPVIGSFSFESGVLTIIKFRFNNDSLYVNSHWNSQDDPYKGDVINVFNDGVMGNVGPFGPFYEMESSSNARALKVGESLSHEHAVYHFEGEAETLDKIAYRLLGVRLGKIISAFD